MAIPDLVKVLADGRFHSGADLAQAQGVSRTAIWKGVRSLRDHGIVVNAIPGRGYCLDQPMELLDGPAITAALSPESQQRLSELTVLLEVDSTNRYLLDRAREGAAGGLVCLAEMQTAGRGRRGRSWVSPFGNNIYLSLLLRYDHGIAGASALGLVAAIAVARALSEVGAVDIGVKWPNDVVCQERKLGGILLEMAGDPSGRCVVVVGVGLNLAMPAAQGQAIDQAWTDLASVTGGRLGRNKTVAAVLEHMVSALTQFERDGFAPFSAQWQSLDVLRGRGLSVSNGQEVVRGVGQGIDRQGALLVQCDHGVQRFFSGEVSVRADQAAFSEFSE